MYRKSGLFLHSFSPSLYSVCTFHCHCNQSCHSWQATKKENCSHKHTREKTKVKLQVNSLVFFLMHHEHLVYLCNHHFFFWHFQVDCDCHQSCILSQMPTHLNTEEQTAHTQIRPVPICKFVRRLHTVKPWDDPSWIMESDMTGTGGLPSSGTQSFYLCFSLKGFWGQKFTCCSLSKKDGQKKKPKCWQKRFVYWCETCLVSEKSPVSVCLCWRGFAKAWDRIPRHSLCRSLLWFWYFRGNVFWKNISLQ